MKRHRIKLAVLLAPVVLIGCTTSNGHVNYSMYEVQENVPHKIVSVVKASKRSFFWTSCSDLASEVVADLNNQAKALGGTALSQITFETYSDTRVSTPACITGWAWSMLYLLPEFGPWVQSASAEAYVVIDDNPQQKNIVTKIDKISDEENIPSHCASLVSGDAEKIVCGDSKDRVVQKWGNPTHVSYASNKWSYQSCMLEFKFGRLNNYGGDCELNKISNDSFEGSRIELKDN